MNTTALIISVLVIVFIFLIARDLTSWLFKIKHREKQLDKIIELLTDIRNKFIK